SELLVGEVLKPQGIRGEIKVKPFTDSAEDYKEFKRIFLDGEEYKILSVRAGAGEVYLALRGVPDRNAAELLRGKKITVPREEAPEPEEGRYYIADLLESEVLTEAGEKIGKLIDIRQAATDIYTVQSGEKEILFPAVKGVIIQIDVENKQITVDKKRFEEVAVL
ncbi:MAG: ribosome maturation factor RimM, partial [Clostridiales bacterium]|nr:ribosome maturation factor RimM [Clostridiales bacterium]